MGNSNRSSGRRGFTLVELLVVIGIIAVLIGILLPVLGKARESSRRAQCLANQKQIAGAILLYVMSHKTLPGPVTACVFDPALTDGSQPAILNNYYTIRTLSHKDLLQPILKTREVWFCPSSSDLRTNASPAQAASAYNGRVLGYTYKVNNQQATTAEYFFGSWISSDPVVQKSPKKLAQVQRAAAGGGTKSHAQIWMVSDLDSFNFAGPTGSNNTVFGITTYPAVTPGYAIEADRKYKPVHKSGDQFGRCYTFFDGHGEYLLRGEWPVNP